MEATIGQFTVNCFDTEFMINILASTKNEACTNLAIPIRKAM